MANTLLTFSIPLYMAPAADWAGLPVDILSSILEKVRSIQDFWLQSSIQDLRFIQDFVAFGSVCKSWREAATNNKHRLCPQIPWIVLPDYENNQLVCGLRREESEEYTLTKTLSIPYRLTENLHIPYKLKEEGCFPLNYGWILTVSLEEIHPVSRSRMNLFHPVSRSLIELPHMYPHERISRAALSSNPSQTSDFALTIVQEMSECLSYTSLVDKRWTQIPQIQLPNGGRCSDVTYYQDRLYAVDYNGGVWSLGFRGCSASDLQDDQVLVADLSIRAKKAFKTYMVGFEGKLLVVVRNYANMVKFEEKWVDLFEVHRVDLINGEHKRIRSLGGKAIFVGHNTTTTIFEFPGGLIKRNHIYYTAYDAFCSHRLKDGRRKRLKVPMSLGTSWDPFRYPTPFWYMPTW